MDSLDKKPAIFQAIPVIEALESIFIRNQENYQPNKHITHGKLGKSICSNLEWKSTLNLQNVSMQGTNTSSSFGAEPTGKKIEITGLYAIKMKDGKITGTRILWQ